MGGGGRGGLIKKFLRPFGPQFCVRIRTRAPGSATVTSIDRTGLNSFTLLFIRLRKGEVECKPTLVALSRESGKRSSTGESDGFTDNEYSYTDDDTDGERLVTGNKPPHVTGSADNVRYSIVFLVLQCHFDL